MFSKSKRFPEAGKDYVPGPGEYHVYTDDAGRHKRYGFLTQTNRFPEGQQDPFTPHEFYANGSESTTTTASISISSTTSSNRTLDNPNSRSSPRRASTSPTETANPFEKYKYAMQKEIGILQAKSRKMEATIQTLETEKINTKALLLDRDVELADLRSKNAMLQKTIQRQDKSTKAAQLQKKVEHLEETFQNSQIEHAKQLQEKETMLRLAIETHKQSVCDLEKSQEVHTLREAQIQILTVQLSESQSNAAQQDIQIADLKHKVTHISLLEQQLETQNAETNSLKQSNHDLMAQLQARQDWIHQLESRLVLKEEEVDALLNTVEDRDRVLQENASTIQHLDQRFNAYRDYMDTTVVPHLRRQTTTTEQTHIKELNGLLTELHQAKRFINKQAQSMDMLKSSVYWLNLQNTQIKTLVHCMYQQHKNQWAFNKTHLLSQQDDDPVSIDSSKIVLNDSGFGIFADGIQ